MPLYEYRCQNEHLFEVIHGMSEPGPETCPDCGAQCERQISAPGGVKVRGGRRRKDIKVRKPGETINLKRDSGEI